MATPAAPSIATATTIVKIISSLMRPLLQWPRRRTLPEAQAIQRHKRHPDKHSSNSSSWCREVTLASEILSKNEPKGLYHNANILTSPLISVHPTLLPSSLNM